MKVFAVAGMPGAGKSTIMELAKRENFFVIRMGDLVIDEVRRRGLDITDGTVGRMADMLRMEHSAKVHGRNIPLDMFSTEKKEEMLREGLGYWAVRTVERIREQCTGDVVFIDGTRGDMEVRVFRRRFNDFKVLAVHTSREERYKRVSTRKREDDILSYDGLVERDKRELSWGLGNVIATADVMFVNDGTLTEFNDKVEEFIQSIIKQ